MLIARSIQVGRYQLHHLIGAGRHGSVYRASLIGDTAEVALRLLDGRLAADPQFRARLDTFAGSLAALDHPALDSVVDWGVEDGQPFLVTRLERGTPLDRIDFLALEPAAAVRAIVGAFEAVAHLHRRGIVHGDLRPANLALREDGTLGIMDAALARWLGAAPSPACPYLSPECAAGAPITAAADCYALGVVLYQLVTGVLPAAPLAPPSAVRAGVPAALDPVVLRLLHPLPEARFPSAEAAADALRPFAAASPGAAAQDAQPRRAPLALPLRQLRGWVGKPPRPPLAATLLTALVIGMLAAATAVGARSAPGRPGPLDTFLPAATVALEPPATATPPTPTLPVVAALPPPVVITPFTSLGGAAAVSRALTGSAAITGSGAVSGAGAVTGGTALTGAAQSSRPSATPTPPPPAYSSPDSLLYVVSPRQGVPESYVPADLVPIDGLVRTTKANVRLRRIALDAFRRLVEGMRAAGLEPVVAEGYLSPAEQRDSFAKLVAQHGQSGAERLRPKPGFDEHQLGTVVDFVSPSQGLQLDDRFNDSPEGRWLLANAPKYGFLQSAPPGKEAVLGVKGRPWQYRYVGELAYDIASRNLTLEEYLAARR
ncbi:MAG: D-alanyl-D-alanine carboxypeptidase family protein [Dehalococcoidia bacterium]|nr:D-alanyl-D-alanine carboxypeptidase family protein [Dehalococcoidia bacterium]